MSQKINWFIKSRRAQSVDDYETWNQGGVTPTLNLGDNTGDTRATVVILFEPKSAFEENWGESEVKNALRANASKSSHAILFEATRVDDVRVYDDEIVPTVISRYGTGGGNVPAIFPIQNTVIGRKDEAGPQGKGYANDGEPMFTVDTTSPHAIAIPIQDGREMNKKQNGLGIGENGDPAYTVDTISRQAVATSTVRRLTPVECERLQGFPDNWTEGQADSHRYKQMGNAVAVPVVEWIVKGMVEKIA